MSYVLPAPPYNLAEAQAAHVEIVRIRKFFRAAFENRVGPLRDAIQLYEESCGREDDPTPGPLLDAAEFGDENGPPKAVVGPPGWKEIYRAVMHEFQVTPENFYGSGRNKQAVEAREFCTTLCRRLTAMSFPQIAMSLRQNTHSTARDQHQRMLAKMAGSPAVCERLERLEKKIRGERYTPHTLGSHP